MEISPEAMRQLSTHSWPGNVRELFNVIERTVIMTPGNVIRRFNIHNDRESLEVPENLTPVNIDISLKEQVAALERRYLRLILEEYHGQLKQVAEHSGLNPRTLYRKMKIYTLNKKEFR
jgi:Response regulator containing CheY-like receiver, AAA-type ATPase, and DNA-binding domains